jgi:DNA repair protein RadD
MQQNNLFEIAPISKYSLRDYQVAPYNTAVSFFSADNPVPSILVAPTAFGKSILIAHVAGAIEGKTLILQPSKELLEQNYEKFTNLGGYAAIYSASAGVKRFGNIMYATIGSIKDLGPRFALLGFTNLIIDEVHLYPRGVDSMIGKFLEESGIKKVLGLTATPFKLQSNTNLDGTRFSKLQMLTSRSKMGQFFKDIIHVTQINELTAKGFWSSLEYECHAFNEDGLVYNSVKSDYTEESLRFNFDKEEIAEKILYRLRSLDRKSVIIFVPTIDEAISLSQRIPGSAAVHSNLHPADRKRIIDQFKIGKIKYVFNVNILATGFDHSGVDCIIMGRKTASLAWFYQALGRGTRIDPFKKDCLIIDYVGNVKRFGKIEFIYFKKKKTWQIYGEGGRLLSGIAMDQIGQVFDSPVSGVVMPFGKYKGKDISSLPKEYLEWMLKDFTWSDRNYYIKEACEQILKTA